MNLKVDAIKITNHTSPADAQIFKAIKNQRTNGPVNAHLMSWPSKAQNLEYIR